MASNALSMVGMANKAGRTAVGEEPCDVAVRGKHARLLLLASDATDNTRRRCDHFAEVGNCLLVTLPDTKAELGGMLGRSSCAIVAVTDIGFASSIVKRLAAQDPATYGQDAEKMELKAKRALERRSEMAKAEKAARKKAQKEVYHGDAPAMPQRPRKEYTPSGEKPRAHKPYAKPYKSDGERKPYKSDGERKPYKSDGERKPYKSDGERKPYKSDGERKPYTPGTKRSATPFAGSRPVKKGKGSRK